MANVISRKKRNPASHNLLRKRNRKIWEQLNVDNLLNYMKTHDPRGFGEWEVKTNYFMTQCTHHNDRKPSMHINVAKGFVKCFACGYYESDPIKFLSDFTSKSVSEMVASLEKDLFIKVMTPAQRREADSAFARAELKNDLYQIFNSILIDAINHYQSVEKNKADFINSPYGFAWDTVTMLENRGLLNDVIALPIGILPAFEMIEERVKVASISGRKANDQDFLNECQQYLLPVLKNRYEGYLVFVYHSNPNTPTTFRFRSPKDGPDGQKIIIELEDKNEDSLGLFGLNLYTNRHFGTKNISMGEKNEQIGNTTRAILVEGEFDQMSYVAGALREQNLDAVILAHGGGANKDLSDLADLGIKEICYIPDHDAGGEENIRQILMANPHFNFKLFKWPLELLPLDPNRKMDLDLAITQSGFKRVHEALKVSDTNWIKPEVWLKDKVAHIVNSRGLSENFNEVTKIVYFFAECLGDIDDTQDHLAMKSWIRYVIQDLGFSEEDAKIISINFGSDRAPEEMFLSQIEKKLLDEYEFIGINRDQPTQTVTAYHKSADTIIDFIFSAETQMKALFGSTIGLFLTWVRADIGIPDFIKYNYNPKTGAYEDEKMITTQENMVIERVFLALKNVVSKVPSMSAFTKYTQGVHWLKTKTGKKLFLINGSDIFLGDFNEYDALYWTKLDSPVFENYFFKTSTKKWSDHVTFESIKRKPQFTLKQRILKMQKILDVGFRFKDQKNDALGIAAMMSVLTVMKIYGVNYQFLASNERSTGKSMLFACMIGGAKNSEINLCEHSVCVDNITAAGMRQLMDGSSLTLVIDEFDNQKASAYRAEKMEDILTMLRTSSTGDGVYTQGTAQGKPRVYILSFPAFIAGIDPDINDANMTRFFTVDLAAGCHDKLPPQVDILQKFSVEEIEELKIANTLDSFSLVPKLLRSYEEVTQYSLKNPDIFGTSTIQRFKDNMLFIMSVLHAAGLDWKAWCRQTCKSKEEHLSRLMRRSVNEELYNTLLYTPCFIIDDNRYNKRTLSDFFTKDDLQKPETLLQINRAGNGIYLHEDLDNEKWYLIAVWQEAIKGVLHQTPISRKKAEPHDLKNIADRHLSAVPRDLAVQIEDDFEYKGTFSDSDYTVFDITEKVNKAIDRSIRIAAKRIRIKKEMEQKQRLLANDSFVEYEKQVHRGEKDE